MVDMAKPVPIHYAYIERTGLVWKDPVRLARHLLTLNKKKLPRMEVEVSIRTRGSKRTTKQNNYYWAYLGIIEDDTGELADDLHEFFKRKLLPPVFKTILGTEVKLPASTTKLDPLEFTEYISKIEALTGIPAPDPEDFHL